MAKANRSMNDSKSEYKHSLTFRVRVMLS